MTMTENNQSLEEILFDLAVQKPDAAERSAFLDSVCRDNPALRAQLDELLEAHFGGVGFLPKPAVSDPLPAALRVSLPTETPAQMIGRYKLLEKIGEGGMGEVWKATDTTLGREVAIKVLPREFSADAERLARFEREAKVLASLNHTGIAGIYGFHDVEGTRFLAMELVPGEDLAERLKKGSVPVVSQRWGLDRL